MDRAADLVAEHVVDQLVLLDAREAVEAIGHDLGAEVVPAARRVLNRHLRSWEGLLYARS